MVLNFDLDKDYQISITVSLYGNKKIEVRD